jgi:hypothetical protein
MKIKLTKQQEEFLLNGTVVNTKGGEKWIYFPYWFKETNEQGVFEEYTFEQLPEGIKKYLNNLKEKK